MYPVSFPCGLLHDTCIYRKNLYPLMVHPLTASSQVVYCNLGMIPGRAVHVVS